MFHLSPLNFQHVPYGYSSPGRHVSSVGYPSCATQATNTVSEVDYYEALAREHEQRAAHARHLAQQQAAKRRLALQRAQEEHMLRLAYQHAQQEEAQRRAIQQQREHIRREQLRREAYLIQQQQHHSPPFSFGYPRDAPRLSCRPQSFCGHSEERAAHQPTTNLHRQGTIRIPATEHPSAQCATDTAAPKQDQADSTAVVAQFLELLFGTLDAANASKPSEEPKEAGKGKERAEPAIPFPVNPQPTPLTSSQPQPTLDAAHPQEKNETQEPEKIGPSLDERIKLAVDIANTNTTLLALSTQFENLQNSFTFPAHIDFAHNTDNNNTTPSLAYTPANAEIHGYENSLINILMKLDGVESHGIDMIREARRKLVGRVEKELESLDEKKIREWKALANVERSSENEVVDAAAADAGVVNSEAVENVEESAPHASATATTAIVDPENELPSYDAAAASVADLSSGPTAADDNFVASDVTVRGTTDDSNTQADPILDSTSIGNTIVQSTTTDITASFQQSEESIADFKEFPLNLDLSVLPTEVSATELPESTGSTPTSSPSTSPKDDFALLEEAASDSDSATLLRHSDGGESEQGDEAKDEFQMVQSGVVKE